MPEDAAAVNVPEGELLSSLVGDQIRQLRGRHDLTLAELAARCGLSQPFLSQVERGKATPSLLTLHRIAQAFGTDVPTLLGGIGNDPVSLLRAAEGQVFERGEEPGEVRERLLVGSRRLMEPGEVVVRPGGSSGHAIEHAGEEFIYVVEEVSFGWTSADVDPSGVIGDPTLASAERGKAAFEACVERLGEALAEVARFSFPK